MTGDEGGEGTLPYVDHSPLTEGGPCFPHLLMHKPSNLSPQWLERNFKAHRKYRITLILIEACPSTGPYEQAA